MMNRKFSCTVLAAILALQVCGCQAKESASSSTTEASGTTAATAEETTTEESSSEETTTTTTEASSSETTEAPSSSSDPSAATDGKSLEEQIKGLDRVISCEPATPATAYIDSSMLLYESKYNVTFDMPLDWKNPDAGSFPLRTTFTFIDKNASTSFICDGYNLYDMEFSSYDTRRDLAWVYNMNEIRIEHRFFGGSVPEGLSIDKTDYWEYLTDENASEDFHFIVSQFKKILPGKVMFTGGSKGGQLTNMQSFFHPEDADLFVSVVAPGGCDPDAPDFFDYIYKEIGDQAYGKDKAQKYRDMVLQLQVEAIKHRDVLAPKYYQQGLSDGCIFTDFVTPDILYDMAVLEFATTAWQYGLDTTTIKQVLDMKDPNDPNYIEQLYNLIYDMNKPDIWAHNSEYFAYYVQAAKQNGEHEYDFSFLREALEKDGSGAKLVITEDMEKGLLFRMVFTPEQYEAFTFDPTVYNNMVKWSHETKSTVVMIYGAADVWYSMRLPDVTDNENIHIFTLPDASHMASFERMSKEMSQEVTAIVDPILKWESGSSDNEFHDN